jgi:hypothetical protein
MAAESGDDFAEAASAACELVELDDADASAALALLGKPAVAPEQQARGERLEARGDVAGGGAACEPRSLKDDPASSVIGCASPMLVIMQRDGSDIPVREPITSAAWQARPRPFDFAPLDSAQGRRRRQGDGSRFHPAGISHGKN